MGEYWGILIYLSKSLNMREIDIIIQDREKILGFYPMSKDILKKLEEIINEYGRSISEIMVFHEEDAVYFSKKKEIMERACLYVTKDELNNRNWEKIKRIGEFCIYQRIPVEIVEYNMDLIS